MSSSSTLNRKDAEERLVTRASSDEDFRARLIADPHAAIADELGEPLPGGLEVEVVEEVPGKLMLVLPAASDALSDEELDAVAGGYDKNHIPKKKK